MKTLSLMFLSLAWMMAGAPAQAAVLLGATPATVTERGPHHRVLTRALQYQTAGGLRVERPSRYVELASGMHFFEDNEWREAVAEVEILQGAAVARKGQHQVIFAANLNSVGAIDLIGPDDRRLRSTVVGLAYYDHASGLSVLLAVVQDCPGAVLPPHQVLYLDAFDGDCAADVRYTYTRGGFEQDVILLTAPPSPAEWGLDPSTTSLEVWSEFFDPPQPVVRAVVLREETDPVRRQTMVEPDLIDERLQFGALTIDHGRAFPLAQGDDFGEGSIPTAKRWQTIQGRTFLIEQVEYEALLPHLNQLPQVGLDPIPAAQPGPRSRMARSFPPRPQGLRGTWRPNQYARISQPRAGVVVDYMILNSSLTNHVFKADTTYYISDTVNLYGTTVLEGGTVIKFKEREGSLTLKMRVLGPLSCSTTPWHPAFLTARDDDSVGEVLDVSDGVIDSEYGYIALQLGDSTHDYDLHDLRIRHLRHPIALESNNKLTLDHSQITHGNTAFWCLADTTVRLGNILIHAFTNKVFYATSTAEFHAEHLTVHQAYSLGSYTNTFYLTNSLLIRVTNDVGWAGSAGNVQTNWSTSGVFQTLAAGEHYLASQSAYRDIGTTNISAALLEDLRARTTHPPGLLDQNISLPTVWAPQAPGDFSWPDLGYHYDRLDYVARSIALEDCLAVMTNGVVVGIDFGGTNYGIRLGSGSQLISQGTASRPNRLVRIHAVQEDPSQSGGDESILADTHGAAQPPSLHLRFTEVSLMSSSHLLNQERDRGTLAHLELLNCEIRGGAVVLSTTVSGTAMAWTNNLFERVFIEDYPYQPISYHCWNNLFWEGAMVLSNYVSGSAYNFTDNLFDLSTLAQHASISVTGDYNGYVTNATRWSPAGGSDVVLTNIPSYQAGTFGGYYYPTNDGMLSALIDAGSRNATNAGLHHFTLPIHELAETNSTVDIGHHFVAYDLTNQILPDSDGDGIPDYLEDSNGNGSYDSALGETDWQSYDSSLGVSSGPGLVVFTPLLAP